MPQALYTVSGNGNYLSFVACTFLLCDKLRTGLELSGGHCPVSIKNVMVNI